MSKAEPLPSGTVTFLFTDLQDSTPLWERMPAEMQASIALHHALLRRAIETNGGQVYQIIGDEFQSAFRLATQALSAALAAQRALRDAAWGATGPLRARMGLHTGPAEVDPLEDAPYAVSHTLNRAGRIRSAAHGGQILLSQEARDLVARHLPDGVALKDLGEHHLKGMQLPEQLYQVLAPDLPQVFPPLAGTGARRGNLPVQLTSFIGREKEIAEVRGLLEAHRLVTLTGSGGTGKTRLSLRAAGEVAEGFPDGAWLVELAPLADPDKVPQAIITTLGLHDSGSRPPLELLVSYFAEKRLLLVLDNCEHLIDACARLADRLLRECPRLTLLASSREALGVPGETAYRVPSLQTPDPREHTSLEALVGFEAVRLFAERASAAHPGFAVTPDNAAAVAQLCRRLDGIPLAIELAAARVGLLSVEQIAARLDNRFRLLTGGARTALPRQQTLRASIDWSYSLLAEPERLLLMRLSVFTGGWTLEAAEQVCSDTELEGFSAASAAEAGRGFAGLADFEVLDRLDGLVRKSLVVADSQAGSEIRYGMLETVRQYAREKLFENGSGEVVRARHLDYYLRLAQKADPHLRSFEQVAWSDRLEAEIDNLLSALAWAEEEQVEKGMSIAWALRWFWPARAGAAIWQVSAWLDRVLTTNRLAEHPTPEQILAFADAMALQGSWIGLWQASDKKMDDTLFDESQRYYQLQGQAGPIRLIYLYSRWGNYFDRRDHVRAREKYRQALAVAEAHGDLVAIAEQRIDAFWSYDLSRNIELRNDVLEIHRQVGDLESIWWDLLNLASLYSAQGELAAALKANQEGLEIIQKARHGWGLRALWYQRGCLYELSGELLEAQVWMKQAMEQALQAGDVALAECVDVGLARVCISLGSHTEAQSHFNAALARARKDGLGYLQGINLFSLGELALARGDTAEAEKHYQQGLALAPVAFLGTEPFGLLGLGKAALAQGDWLRARAYFRQAIETWAEAGIMDFIAYALEVMAVLAVTPATGVQLTPSAARTAARMHGAGQAWSSLSRLVIYYIHPHFEHYDLETCLAPARALLGEEGYQKAYAEGLSLSPEQAASLALEDWSA